MENNIDIYRTRNLFIATYLNVSGKVKFLGLETVDNKTKLFLYSPLAAAKELETDYFAGGQMPVKTVFAEYNNLKDMLFNRESNGGERT